jgi:hypothetical protein
MQGRLRQSSGQHAHLPIIAPRQGHDAPQSESMALNAAGSEARKNRLPPRSRSGCWYGICGHKS